MDELTQLIADEYDEVRSLQEFHQSTARLAREETNADFGVVAVHDNAEVHALATNPADWVDSDDLLSPVSLPTLASARGESYVIDDKSNVRSVPEGKSARHGSLVSYPSLLSTPFLENGFLLVGSTTKSAFYELDLERLRIISTIGSLLYKPLAAATTQREMHTAIEEATSFLSHDAKNLLSVINGRVQLARDAPDGEHFDAIESNLERLDALIEDTRTLLETGERIAEVELVSLREVAHAAWENVESEEAELVTDEMIVIMADESRLCQLLENLFRNALEHAGPDVTVRVGLLDDGQGFYVEDDGPGIDPDERDSLFDLGYSSKEDHSGVGLTIVERVASAHDWQVAVTDGSTGGARFEVSGIESPDE